MKRYLREILLLSAGMLMAANVNAQCVYNTAFGSATVGAVGETVTATSCAFAGEYSTFNGLADGGKYQFSNKLGGADGYITITDTSNNVLQHGPSPLTYTSGFDGSVRMHYSADNSCAAIAQCRTGQATTLSDYDGPNALFQVTKTFTDGNPSEVEVSLSCNTGLILDQSKMIAPGETVTFVVKDFTPGVLNCTVTETPVPGYDTSYSGGTAGNSEGCTYENLEPASFNICKVTNTPAPVDVVITKEWVFEGNSEAYGIDLGYRLTLWCDAFIIDGDSESENSAESPSGFMGGCDSKSPKAEAEQGIPYYGWCKDFWGNGPEEFVAQVIPEYPDSDCQVFESLYDDAVEVDNGCTSLTVSAGQGAACTVTNTVFFEGIPTLSQYGMALLCLLMLGVGLASFRRFS